MRTIMKAAVVLAVMFAAGCHAHLGTWKLAPGQSAGEISFGAMTLAKDGTFTADASYHNDTKVITGHYTFGDGEVTFEADGKTRTYGAFVVDDDMTITHESKSVKMVRLKPKKRSWW